MTRQARAAVALALVALAPAAARAQIRASEAGTVSQTIDGTTLTVRYSRPRLRGRFPIFGSRAVHWGETWTPGANWATTLDVSRDIRLGGRPVPKGTYSVWMVVRQSGEWTTILDARAHRFHMNRPDTTAAGQVRIPVRADSGPLTEVLTWSFPEIRADGGTLAMQWGRTRVAMDVTVQPSLTVTMPAADAQPYLGRFDYLEYDEDSTKAPTHKLFTVSYRGDTLEGQWEPEDRYMKRFALIRIAPDLFAPGLYDEQGRIYEVMRPDMTFEFKRTAGRVTGLEVRGANDEVWARGIRKP